jgi:parvulin-like peptidyl-prolyl isomerase
VTAGVVATPQPVQAQEAAATATVEISDEKLVAFAAAFLEISALRDEVNNELGRVHDAQGKAAIREKLEQKVAEILAQHELDAKQYQRLLYAVSAEPATRERFDRVMETLKPKPTTG